MIDKEPFSDSWSTIGYAVGLAVLGGLVKYLNHSDTFKVWTFIRDLVTAGFCGLLTLWATEWMNIQGPLMAILIAASGLLGTRLLREIETLYLMRLGFTKSSPIEDRIVDDAKAGLERSASKAQGE